MAEQLDKYSRTNFIHQESYDVLHALFRFNLKPFHQCPLEEVRHSYKQFLTSPGLDIAFDGEIQDLILPAPSSTEDIPVSVFKPRCLASSSPPIIVYFHGGGLIFLDSQCVYNALKKLAEATGCIVVNVEYRLLPYPGKGHDPFDDAVVATKWVLENREKVGGRSDSLVGVAGDSAGGQIAATVSNEVRGLAFQVLVYPHVDLSLQQPSVEEFADAPILAKADLDWINEHIAQTLPEYLTDPRVNPIVHPDVGSSPPTLVVLAQCDTIRDSGLAYAQKLRSAGVRVQTVIIEGALHGFFIIPAVFKTTAAQACEHISQFVKDITGTTV